MMLGKGGVTHNMIDDIHNHWKKAEAVRIKCLGVPTLDMDNICHHLEVSLNKILNNKTLFVVCMILLVVCVFDRKNQVERLYTGT